MGAALYIEPEFSEHKAKYEMELRVAYSELNMEVDEKGEVDFTSEPLKKVRATIRKINDDIYSHDITFKDPYNAISVLCTLR